MHFSGGTGVQRPPLPSHSSSSGLKLMAKSWDTCGWWKIKMWNIGYLVLGRGFLSSFFINSMLYQKCLPCFGSVKTFDFVYYWYCWRQLCQEEVSFIIMSNWKNQELSRSKGTQSEKKRNWKTKFGCISVPTSKFGSFSLSLTDYLVGH